MESDLQEIVLKEIHGNELRLIIDYCYTGFIQINEENVYRLLEASSKMEFNNIEMRCAQVISSMLSLSNCLRVWSYTEPFMNLVVFKRAEKLIHLNFTDIVKSEEFLLLTPEQLLTLFKSDDLNVFSEEDVYKAFIKWLSYDENVRKFQIFKLLSAIRLTQLKSEVIFLFST